ncbi:MAG: phosphodiester glycosidase family protein [Myxococcota bacterium]|nr:phosphodiester glycosidase family protein [Myxococcota bacterium]
MITSALVALVSGLAPSVASAADTWSDPYPGVRRLRRVTANQNVNVLVVDLCAPGVSVRGTATNERGRTVSSFGALVGAQAAINGDFFRAGYTTDGPSGAGGARWGGGDHGYVAPAQFGVGKVALPGHEGTGGVEPWAREVVSGHPSIVVNGSRRDNNGDSLCTARHPRTVLGFSKARDKLFLGVIDGRATTRIGMTCDEMAAMMLGLGAHDVVNLDGGGSSTMWLAGTGVVNNPSDGSQRVVGNHLAIRATGTGDAPHCSGPRYEASFTGVQAPTVMTSGEEAVVWMELKNDGLATWDVTNTRVGTQGPQDRASAFYKEENWITPNRPSAVDSSGFSNGKVGRFTWAMVAPEVTESTRFDETFQLVQEGVAWFGPEQTMSIIVHPRSGPTNPDPDPLDPDPPVDGDDDGGGCATGSGSAGLGLGLAGLVGLVARRRRRR